MAVSKPDFTKQFGSAKADLTPVSSSNYAQGWDYVGSTPPTKNDFTYLQNLADQRSIWLFENYGSGRLLNIQRFTGSGTYTPTAGAKTARARIVAGGGGGGGCPATGSTQQATGGGGQSGGYAEHDFTISAASYPLTVGTPGIRGAVGSAGGGGGSSIIGGVITVPGGVGGYAGNAVAPTASLGSATNSYTAPTVTTGTLRISVPPKAGQPAFVLGSGTNQAKGGNGGDSPLGNGGQGGLGGAPGLTGAGFGGGGGGCSQLASNNGDVGGAGSGGYIEIWEFA